MGCERYLHAKIPEINQVIPVLDVGSRDHQLLLLPGLLAVVSVPQEPHHGLARTCSVDYNSIIFNAETDLNKSEY